MDKPAKNIALSEADIADAKAQLERLRPYIANAFPEATAIYRLIESPLRRIPHMQSALAAYIDMSLSEIS